MDKFQVAYAVNLVALASYLAAFLISYSAASNILPTSFDFEGRAIGVGAKETLLIPMFVSIATTTLMLVLTLLRHRLISKYPYVINLPALVILLGSKEISEEERKEYIDRIFLVIPVFSLAILVILGAVSITLLESAKAGRMVIHPTLLIALIYAFTATMIVGSLLYYRKIHRALRTRIG